VKTLMLTLKKFGDGLAHFGISADATKQFEQK